LPAACLAMYHTARPERRRVVGGLLASIALTSLLTGVTEPIEFTFMFLAPILYAVHALLTGIAFVIMNALHVRLGFGFSAGLFDYILNFNKATRPLLLVPVGLLYFGLYYGLFRFVIVRFDLKTPGREAGEAVVASGADRAPPAERALAYITALGGPANIVALDACTTRLRLVVGDQSVVDVDALKRLGVRGIVKPSANALQVVVGTNADQVAGEMKAVLRAGGLEKTARATGVAAALLAALGGRSNIRTVETASSRLRINIVDTSVIDEPAMASLGLRGVVVPAPNWVHVIIGPGAAEAGVSLRHLLA
jgi:PTS system N-acetylglucosamine-specific IIC component